jgi:hypothetical protein
VGGARAVHVADGVLSVYDLAAPEAGGGRNSTLLLARLQDLFAPVGSSNCRDGVHDAAAAFDPRAGRYYVAAACGGSGSALLAVSATAEPHGVWYLYNLNADGVGTRLACAGGEAALLDYPRITFDAHAIALSVHSYCPSAGGAPGAHGAGAALLVVPKGAASRGEARMAFALFTSAEVAEAAGGAVPASAVVQLEPAAPQREADAAGDALYFIADVGLAELACLLGFGGIQAASGLPLRLVFAPRLCSSTGPKCQRTAAASPRANPRFPPLHRTRSRPPRGSRGATCCWSPSSTRALCGASGAARAMPCPS